MPRREIPSHAFVKQYLREKESEIYVKGEKILKFNKETYYNIDLVETKIEVSVDEHAELPPKISIIDQYNRLLQMGLCITSRRATKRWIHGQKVMYVLEKKKPGVKAYEKWPSVGTMHVEYDRANKRARAVHSHAGPRGVGPWVNLRRRVNRGKVKLDLYDVTKYIENKAEIIQRAQMEIMGVVDEELTINIPEMPVLETDAGELVCIENTPDEATIGIVGQRGSGKSYLMHRIIDSAFWKKGWQKQVVILNDSLKESGTYSVPVKREGVFRELDRIGEAPRGLPVVHIVPNMNDVSEVMHENEGVGFRMTLPYKELIKNFETYFTLEKSRRYFETIVEELLECKNVKDVRDVIDNAKMPGNSKPKIETEVVNLIKTGITDLETTTSPFWEVRNEKFNGTYNPLTTCMLAGVVPVLQTDQFSDKRWYPQYFKYLVEDLFNRQKRDKDFRREKLQIWLFVDEARDVGTPSKVTVATETLNKVVTQGRPLRIGTVLAVQNYNQIPTVTRANIKYLFTFANPQEAGNISKDYNIRGTWADEIRELPKYECIAVTTEEFVVYDANGNKTKSKGPFRGKAISPLGLHKAPKSE